MRYLYYRLWQLFTRIKTNDMPATNAMIFLSMCIFANVATVHILLDHFSIVKINMDSRFAVYSFTVPLGLLILSINYFLLYKYRNKLHEKYKNESKKQKILGNILLVIYIIGSFALVFYFGPKYTTHVGM